MVGKQKRARLDLVGNASGFFRIDGSFNKIIIQYYKKNINNICNYQLFLNSVKSELI